MVDTTQDTAQLNTLTGDGETVDLAAILHAWNEATQRLQNTHETLRTEVRRLTEELEEKNRELARKNRLADLGQMASHVAHEVRNSLMPVTLYLSLLRRKLQGDDACGEVLNKLEAGFTALEVTVNDLLHFAKDRAPQWEHFEAARLCQEVLQSVAPQLAAQRIHAEVQASPESFVTADREMIRRAVLNLVLNAVDAMPAGGYLVVTAAAGEQGLEIEVADSGPGLPETDQPHLFEPFFTTKHGGTGLGLVIVQRIADAHGGCITACNCPDGGAAFTLHIPQQERRAAA